MKEAGFIKQNRDEWKRFENLLLDKSRLDPDQLSDIFIRLTDDLAYARTYFPNSRTVVYLNALAASIHQSIYQNKKEKRSRVKSFWAHEVPLVSFLQRNQILYATLFFLVFSLLGVFSTAYDPDFVRLILGDGYVNMTLENIKNGKPMGVYDSMDEITMFLRITTNNILVSFRVFVAGIVFSFGSVVMLFYNGIMLGAFQYFFHQQGLLAHSASTIWIHGTLEISAIVIAGGAGLIMGNHLLFPGTYPRIHSLRKGVKLGLKLLISLVPVFITAGFLESFVTRYEYMHWLPKAIIIGGSAFFIIYYYFYLPRKRHG